ncbi:hypothetical protein GCM10027074_28300 [Streptomyces deserti]
MPQDANELRGRRRDGRLAARLGRTAPVAAAAPDHAGGVVEALHVCQALAALSTRDQEPLQLIGRDGLDTAAAAHGVHGGPQSMWAGIDTSWPSFRMTLGARRTGCGEYRAEALDARGRVVEVVYSDR